MAHGFALEQQLRCLPPHPAVAACPLHNRCLQFCATGKGGFARNLLPHEIVDQVLTVQEEFGQVRRTEQALRRRTVTATARCLLWPFPASLMSRGSLTKWQHVSEGRQPTHICGSLPPPPPLQRVSNIVFMGMGEPLLNLPSVLRAHEILNKDIGIGERGGWRSRPRLPAGLGACTARALAVQGVGAPASCPNTGLSWRATPPLSPRGDFSATCSQAGSPS